MEAKMHSHKSIVGILLFMLIPISAICQYTFNGEVHIVQSAYGATVYAPAGSNTATVRVTWGCTFSSYPWLGLHHFEVKLDDIHICDSDGSADVYIQNVSVGPHTVSVQMYEWRLLNQRFPTAYDAHPFTIDPSYNVTVQNDFAGGELYTKTNTDQDDVHHTSVPLEGITRYNVRNNSGLSLTAVDNQTPADGLLRTFNYWNSSNDPGFYQTSSLSTTPTITGAYAYQANFHKQPSQPQNLALVQNSNPVNLSWDNTTEPNFQYWEVWRKVTQMHGRTIIQDWTMIATRTTNSFEDPDFAPNSTDPKTVAYKLRAKGAGDLYSSYSSEVSLRAEQLFYKKAGNEPKALPTELLLSQNYPNPFNPTTSVSYALPEASDVRIAVYNATGIEVDVLVSGNVSAGFHEVSFNATRLPSGIYFCKMNAGKYSDVKRMLLLK